MEFITTWISLVIARIMPELDCSPYPAKSCGKLRLGPAELLKIVHAQEIAIWSLTLASRVCPAHLAKGPGGAPRHFSDSGILLMAIVQVVWRKSYEQIVDYMFINDRFALQMGVGYLQRNGTIKTISKGQYWERRAELGVWPFFLFFLVCVFVLIRLGAVVGKELIVDSSLLKAWYHRDPGATWQKYAKKASVFGYKVHTVICRERVLPVFLVVTPAHVHDSLVGWFVVLCAAIIFGFRVLIVYADAAYPDKRFFRVVHDFLHAHPAVNYNPRRSGKNKLATPFFLNQWKHFVLNPRSDIERHFAWVKRYFGLKYFQCFTYLRVYQYVVLTYIAVLVIALAACRCQRDELARSRSMVIAAV